MNELNRPQFGTEKALEGILMDWSSRHASTLIKLRAQVLCDIKEFIPEGYFTKKKSINLLDGWARGVRSTKERIVTIKSEPEIQKTWGDYALEVGNELFYNLQATILTPRQLAASELLMYLGFHFLALEGGSEPCIDQAVNKLHDSITKYFDHLKEEEAKPFLPLLSDEQKQPTLNRTINPPIKTNKLRSNTLDPAIDSAIAQAGTTMFPAVYLKLKELALSETPPFSGVISEDGALCYTNDRNKPDKLTKNALEKRLKRRNNQPNNL
ncbi:MULTISPECIES: hypothetical protein [Nitrosomonas]|uniref:Uncharacterized protein n=2 Tax=Nitrosomonas TaxID=914 RepID=A0A0F7KGB7_9PROT|nr:MULTISPECIES: hypothetical protein [Nitrosomonas]AKH38223.1 hypothetical protein AAW31_11180 [Nitrosomonas communis]TYP80670.1 hypothetical protein BCL69_105516 [Nitrosomonas communis]UVS60198.1 hypothetical protein NX761_11805 [Nitrosomonas sp. PLL12]